MVYYGIYNIKNTDDIIQRFIKKDEILKVMEIYYTLNKNWKCFDINNFENVLYNIVDDLKGYQSIIDLENQIIGICNNSINSCRNYERCAIGYIDEENYIIEYYDYLNDIIN